MRMALDYCSQITSTVIGWETLFGERKSQFQSRLLFVKIKEFSLINENMLLFR